MAGRYTEADKIAVKAALMDLALGKRVASVSIAGRTVAYAGGVTKADLERMLDVIDADLAVQAGARRTRARRAITSKGL